MKLATTSTDAAGAFLFSEEALQAADDLVAAKARCGEYSGQRLRKEAPRLVEAARRLAMLDCLTQEEIAHALQLSVNSLRALLLAEETSVDGYKEGHAQSLRELSRLSASRAMEKLRDDEAMKKTSLKDLGVFLGIATEKAELLMGGVTQRVGVRQEAAPVETFNDYIAKLALVREMGFAGEEAGQKGGDLAALAGARTDEASDVSGVSSRVNALPATESAPAEGGRGGLAEFRGGGGEALDCEARHGDKGDL